jgi:tetratricopeptide (TPR) repeat protein
LGELKDDLSLLKIQFTEHKEHGNKLNMENILNQMEEYRKEREFEKFADLGDKLISDYPQLTNSLCEISNAYKEINNFEKAIEFGERVRLREPKNLTNLINLIQSYNGDQKPGRAKTILKACLKAKPDDERLLKLREEIFM